MRSQQSSKHWIKSWGVFIGVLAVQVSVGRLGLASPRQAGTDTRQLEPGKSIDRELAGGQSHSYLISLSTGQYLHIEVEQIGVDVALSLLVPDGSSIDTNLTAVNGRETISCEAGVDGRFQLVVKAVNPASATGMYRIVHTIKPSATARDRQTLKAEALLNDAGRLAQNRNSRQAAIDKFQQSMTLWRDVGDHYWEAFALFSLGYLHAAQENAEKAISFFEQAVTVSHEAKDRLRERNALDGLGVSWFRLGRFDKASGYFDLELAIIRESGDRRAEGQVLSKLGHCYRALNSYEKAIEYHQQALSIARKLNDRSAEVTILNGLASANGDLGRDERAIEYFEQALAVSRETKDRGDEATILNNLGVTWHALSRYEKAIEYFLQTISLSHEVKSRYLEMIALNGLGREYRSLNLTDRSLDYHKRALAISREIKDKSHEGFALTDLGNTCRSLKRYDDAIAWYEQALMVRREVKDQAGVGRTLGNLGAVYQELGKYDKSVACYEQALEISEQLNERPGIGNALTNLGNVNRVLGRYEKAIDYYERALVIKHELKDRASEASTLYNFAIAERDRGNLDRARAMVDDALRIVESLRADLNNQEFRSSYFASVQDEYQFYVDLLMQFHQSDPHRGYDALALEAAERARARSLLDLLAEARADIRHGVDPALLERELTLQRRLDTKALARTTMLSRKHNEEQVAALEKEISELSADYQGVEAQIRRSSPRYAEITQPQPLSTKEIRQSLDADTILLEFSLGKGHSYVWAVTPGSIMGYQLPPQAESKRRHSDSATCSYPVATEPIRNLEYRQID